MSPGDVVNIYHRATPYRHKVLLSEQGTAAHPIVINGVTDGSGNRPTIHAANAVTVNPDVRPTIQTDANGRYLFEGFERGHFWVGIHVDGYNSVNQSVIASLEPEHTVDVRLQRVVRWSGTVVDHRGRPIERVNVRLNGGYPAGTGVDGTCEVRGLEGSSYTLVVQHPDYQRREFTATSLNELPEKVTLQKE